MQPTLAHSSCHLCLMYGKLSVLSAGAVSHISTVYVLYCWGYCPENCNKKWCIVQLAPHTPPIRINWHNQRSGNHKSSQPTITTVFCQVLAHILQIFGTKMFQLLKWKSTVQGNIKGGITIWIFISYWQSLSGEQNVLNFVSVET